MLNEIQKQMVKDIEQQDICNWRDFIIKYIDAKSLDWEKEATIIDFQNLNYTIHKGQEYLLITGNKGIYTKTISFQFVISHLVEQGLIEWGVFGELPQLNLFRPTDDGTLIPPSYVLYGLIGDSIKNSIKTKPSLTQFILRGCRTSDEYKFYREDLRDNRSSFKSWITLFVAFGSLAISAGTYISNREKLRSGSEPVSVKLLNPIIRVDTVVVRDTVRDTVRIAIFPKPTNKAARQSH